MPKESFKNFLAACENLGIEIDDSRLDSNSKYLVGKVWNNVVNFLDTFNLVDPNRSKGSLESLDNYTHVLNDVVTVDSIGPQEILNLVEECRIPQQYRMDAVKAVGACIMKYQDQDILASHFGGKDSALESLGDVNFKSLDTYFDSGFLKNGYYVGDASAALESFGASIDKTLLDARVAIAITILKFHKGIMPRLLPNRPIDSNVVLYTVDRAEVYDLAASQSNSATERYKGTHRVPFVDLYRDPSPANTETKPVVVKAANDSAGTYVFQDGILKAGVTANLFDLSLDSNTIGYSHVDYTDLISEGARVKTVIVEVKDTSAIPAVSEYIPVDVYERPGSRFVMIPNASDAADRVCNIEMATKFVNGTVKLNGVASSILNVLDANHYIAIDLNIQGKINLRTSYASLMGSVVAALKTADGTAPVAAIQSAFDNLEFSVVAWEPDCKFSEENLRKTTKALRILTKPIAFEIPGSANWVVKHSLTQPRPEATINALSNAMRVGNDDRGIKTILNAMDRVYNRIVAEASQPDIPYEQRAMNDFVSGHKVVPYIYKGTIDIDDEVKVMRSAEALSDVRGLVEKKLLEVLTILYNMSFFVQALDPGQRPVFKVLTSGYVLDSILNVPYYHTALDQSAAEKAGDDIIEYRRILPNGTELQVVTTTFDYFTNKILMVPFIPGAPESDLNFGHLWDRGVFVVQTTPFVNNAGFKEIVANSREFPFITTPVGALLEVSGVSKIYENISTLGPTP